MSAKVGVEIGVEVKNQGKAGMECQEDTASPGGDNDVMGTGHL